MPISKNDVGAIAALDEPTRRAIYGFVRGAVRAVNRDEVAAGTGVARRLAAFHLEALLEHGLLQAEYARPPGRGGPGAGRPAKYYRPSADSFEVTVPERHYDLAGELLVDALERHRPGEETRDAAVRVSRERGTQAGERIKARRKLRQPGSKKALEVTADELEGLGFEPYRDGGAVRLRNCPFHVLARRAPDLVCAMNQAFIDGMLRGMGNDTAEAVLTCVPGECCVTVQP